MKTDFDETIEKINIIPQDIGRVLLNLFNNAFYATSLKQKAESLKQDTGAERSRSAGPSTALRVTQQSTDNHYKPTVTVSTKKLDDKIEISVKDNGGGIPEKIKDKIFQPFFTTKPTGEGTGLGLSLSYDMVKAHEGDITVETKEGEGTEFVIILQV